MPEGEHSCFIYTVQGSSQRNSSAGIRSGFSLCRVAWEELQCGISLPKTATVLTISTRTTTLTPGELKRVYLVPDSYDTDLATYLDRKKRKI